MKVDCRSWFNSMGFTISQSFHFPPSSSFCLFFCMTRRIVSQSLGTMWWNFPGMELRNMFENTSIIMYSHVMVLQSSVDVGEIPRLMLNSHYTSSCFQFKSWLSSCMINSMVQSSSQRTRSTFSWKHIFQVELHTAQAINIEPVGASKQCQKSKSYLHQNQLQTFCLTAARLIQVSTLNTSTWY